MVTLFKKIYMLLQISELLAYFLKRHYLHYLFYTETLILKAL